MSLANAYLQNQIDKLNDPTLDRNNIETRIFGVSGKRDAVMALLLGALTDLGIIAAGTVPPPAPVALTRTISVETGSTNSPIPAGAKSIGLIFSSDFAGTIGGAAIDPAQCPSYSENAEYGKKLPALAYTVTAGSMVRSVLS